MDAYQSKIVENELSSLKKRYNQVEKMSVVFKQIFTIEYFTTNMGGIQNIVEYLLKNQEEDIVFFSKVSLKIRNYFEIGYMLSTIMVMIIAWITFAPDFDSFFVLLLFAMFPLFPIADFEGTKEKLFKAQEEIDDYREQIVNIFKKKEEGE
ncbi:hypothetical protein KKG22_04900 [Patescibacteria group bacterium]|nr:hypothetical protein [Patescibacteria group bacterium]MBU1721674.1 hypothetical protein [Patescibacteria group bacterium]MBU1900983.1 hypothetical protein [Patescibacteria group bacterium]